MAFKVDFVSSFYDEAESIAEYISESSGFPNRATNWLQGLFKACGELSTFPERHPKLHATEISGDYRWMSYFSHRVVYEVLPEVQLVKVLAIRTFATPDLPDDLSRR